MTTTDISAALLRNSPELGEAIARQTAASIVEGIRMQEASRPDLLTDLTTVLRRHHPELGELAAERAWSMWMRFWRDQERAAVKAAR